MVNDTLLTNNLNHKKRRKGVKLDWFDYLNYLVMIILTIVFLYPFIYILALSFNDGVDTIKGGVWFLPRVFTFQNYAEAFKNQYILNSFAISIARTVIGTLVSVTLCATLAFALLDKRMKGRRFITKFLFFSTLFSGGIIPFFILLRDLELLDKFGVFIFPALYNFYNVIILRAGFEAVPESLEESFRMDGAGDLTILFKLYIPLSMPSIATVALFTAVFHWNDWFAGAFYISDKNLKPAATLLQEIIANQASENPDMMNTALGQAASNITPQSLQMAFVVILVFPIVVLYPFLQKYFIKGAMVGSIKE